MDMKAGVSTGLSAGREQGLCQLSGGWPHCSQNPKESEKSVQTYSLGVQQFTNKYVILSEVVMVMNTIKQNKAALRG